MNLSQVAERFRKFNTFWDSRFEDLTPATWLTTTYRDFSAGLIVALTAIPMAMGFAMAMGLQPEQGIIAGALACIIGRTWGGSKYQVYGPTAAFIPVIAGLMSKYGEDAGGNFAMAHGFLVFVSIIAGVILMSMGLLGLGKYAKLVPNSIVVGFTVGIAVAIVLSNIGEALGIKASIRGEFFEKMKLLWEHLGEFNGYAFGLAILTFLMARYLLRLSIFIPAPLLALGLCTFLAATVFSDKGISIVRDKYGTIPTNFFVFTPPQIPPFSMGVLIDILYFSAAIVFVSGVESLLCSSMADRLADNRKTPFNPDKEFWGQGLVQIITPMVNGCPCTGALARTATSIKAGAVTPFAGYFKGVLKILMAIFLAPWLEQVPMACIGGILLWVATNMVKPAEIREVWHHSRFHAFLMVFTAVMVPVTDFLVGVLSALVIYGVAYRFLDHPEANPVEPLAAGGTSPVNPRSFPFQTVTVGLALIESDTQLLQYAAMLARQGIGLRFQFLHIIDPDHAGVAVMHRDEASQRIRSTVEAVFRDSIGSTVSRLDVVEGDRTEQMLHYSQQHPADLILLGHRQSGSGKRSLARRMAMLSPSSVWIVPAGVPGEIHRVLAPIDFSPHSADGLSMAAAIAQKVGLRECLAVHVRFEPTSVHSEKMTTEPLPEERQGFQELIDPGKLGSVIVKPLVQESSNVAHAILRTVDAQGCDLIVMSTRGRSHAAAILLGSETEQTLMSSPVPVLAIKHEGAALNLLEVLASRELWQQPSQQVN